MGDKVFFKGINGNLQLILKQPADFQLILTELKTKMEAAAEFFTAGTVVKVAAHTAHSLTSEQKSQLSTLFADHGMQLAETSDLEPVKRINPLSEVTESAYEYYKESYETQALIINRTLRSGQKIVYKGTVVVLGDVNPGAEIIAGGDVIVMGTCRGMVHAGAYGNPAAKVTANRLLANQIRVAGLIARAPDHLDQTNYSETARILNGYVIIEPTNK